VSTTEYVEKLDEDQLDFLIEAARARKRRIEESGWVKLWTINIGWANVAWFEEGAYEFAIERACAEVKRAAAKGSKGIEMEVKLDRYRPEEVADLLARSDKLGRAA
jgi:hypothetical protein